MWQMKLNDRLKVKRSGVQFLLQMKLNDRLKIKRSGVQFVLPVMGVEVPDKLPIPHCSCAPGGTKSVSAQCKLLSMCCVFSNEIDQVYMNAPIPGKVKGQLYVDCILCFDHLIIFFGSSTT